MSRPTTRDPFRFEPTLWGALKRYKWLVVVLIIVFAAAGAAANKATPKSYQANASVAIPASQAQTVFGISASQDPDQYISEQVTLIQSPQVATVAAHTVNAANHRDVLSADDITGNLSVTAPSPSGSSSSATGQAVDQVPISFSWTNRKIATEGVNAVLAGYAQVRNDSIRTQANAAVANINASVASIDQQLGQVNQQLNAVDQQQAQQDAQNQAQAQATLNAGGKVAPSTPSTPNAQAQALTLEQNSLNTRKQDLLQRLDDIQVNEQLALTQAPASILAIPGQEISSSHLLRYTGIGAVAGLLIGAILAYLFALRRRRFTDRFDAEALYEAPLLGDVPDLEAEKIRSNLPVATNSQSAAAEAYRFVAASVKVTAVTGGPVAVAVTSPKVRAGKTMIASNVALALAESGEKVLAIDADFVRQELTSRLLGSDSDGRGLLDVLEGRARLEEVAVRSSQAPDSQLYVLAGGVEGVRLAGVADQLTHLVEQAKESYDIVIIDGPPVLQAAAAVDVLACADGVMVVINHNELVRDHPEVIEKLDLMEAKILGYVYNRAPLRPEMSSYYTSVGTAVTRMLTNGNGSSPAARPRSVRSGNGAAPVSDREPVQDPAG
jgi:Mrp family chromosome partitioning ATPase